MWVPISCAGIDQLAGYLIADLRLCIWYAKIRVSHDATQIISLIHYFKLTHISHYVEYTEGKLRHCRPKVSLKYRQVTSKDIPR